MSYIAVTNPALAAGATILASEHNQNNADIINGLSDGTKDLNVAAIACTTVTPAGSIIPSLTATYDFGTSLIKWRALYLSGAATVGSAVISGAASMGSAVIGSLTGVVKGSSGTITAATLVNADVDAAAAIAVSKLAALTASRAVVTDASGFVSAATTTSTEIGYVNGVTSAIQTQLTGKVGTTGDESISGIKTFSTSIKLATSGGTATALSAYETNTFAVSFNANAGAGGSGINYTLQISRIGDLVILTWPVILITAGATASSFDTAAATIPSRFRPTSNKQYPIRAIANNVTSDSPGLIQILTDGTISIQRTISAGTNFTATQTNNGTPAGSCCWALGT